MKQPQTTPETLNGNGAESDQQRSDYIAATMKVASDNATDLGNQGETQAFFATENDSMHVIADIAAWNYDQGKPLADDQLGSLVEAITPAIIDRRARSTRAIEVDPHTGFGNNAAFTRALATAEGDPDTLIFMFDGDNFGKINKKVSHEAGDEAIKHTARSIKEIAKIFHCERLFRLGGDEFAIIADGMDLETAEQMRDMIVAYFSTRNYGSKRDPVKISLSGGIGQTHLEADRDMQKMKQSKKGIRGVGRKAVDFLRPGVSSKTQKVA